MTESLPKSEYTYKCSHSYWRISVEYGDSLFGRFYLLDARAGEDVEFELEWPKISFGLGRRRLKGEVVIHRQFEVTRFHIIDSDRIAIYVND